MQGKVLGYKLNENSSWRCDKAKAIFGQLISIIHWHGKLHKTPFQGLPPAFMNYHDIFFLFQTLRELTAHHELSGKLHFRNYIGNVTK